MTAAINPIYSRRRRRDIIVRALCICAALFGVTWLALILFTLFYNGLAGLTLQVFTENTPPPGSTSGGLLNAIVGSVIMTVIGVGIGAPLGLFAGTYLAEYGKHDRLTTVIRFINDILLSAPSIIIGNSFRINGSIFAPGTTISAAIASEFAESDGLHQSGLILCGLLLFVLTFFVLAAARLMLMRLEKKAGN